MIGNEVLARQLSELKESVEFLVANREESEVRTQNTEEVVASVTVDIPKLSPNDNIEVVKRVVNQIIEELSKN